MPFFNSFRGRLIVLILLGALPAFGLVIYLNLEQRRMETARVRHEAVNTAQLSALNEHNFTEHTRQLLATLSQFSFLTRATDPDFVQQHLSNLRKLAPDYINFGLVETNGLLFASAEKFTAPLDLADRLYFQNVKRTHKFSVGVFQIGRVTSEPGLNFGYPVLNDEGKLERVLYASLRVSLLSEALSKIPLPPQSCVTVVDRAGTVVARSSQPELFVGKVFSNPSLLERVFQAGDDVFEMTGPDGVSRLHAVSSVRDGDSPGLYAIVDIPSRISYQAANRNLFRNLAFLGIVAAGIVLVASYYAKTSFLRPVTALTGAAGSLAGGNLEARAGALSGSSELVELGRAFDAMAARLQERQREIAGAHQQIRQINDDLDVRVKDRTAALEAANKELETFSYSVSHDLRAPLRHISGFVELLRRKGTALDPDAQRFIEFIATASTQMNKLIQDLLSFSQMSRARMNVGPVDLSQIVAEVKESLTNEINGRAVEWAIQPLPTVHADAALMRVTLTNLMGNAVKYTQPRDPARIEIGVRPDDQHHIIFIRDNGVGFEMKYAEKMFGVFQRFHSADEFEGTGIGLATVYRIISRMGGRVWAESKENEGATFFIALPKNGGSVSA